MTRTRQRLIPTVATVSEDAVYSPEEAPEHVFEDITESRQDPSPPGGCNDALAETAQHRPGGGSPVKPQDSTPFTSSPEQRLQEQRLQEQRLQEQRLQGQPLQSDCESVTSSRESVCSWFEMRFQMETDAARFSCFVTTTSAFSLVYILCASTSFFSSLYPVHAPPDPPSQRPPATVDAFLLTSSIIVIDIASGFFVITGFFCTFLLSNIAKRDVFDLCRIVAVYTIIDVWICTLLSVLLGSIFHLARHTFRAHDIALTLLEGFTCLRAFEISQAWDSMHSLNPTAWPVLCLLYAFMITPCSLASNERLRKCHPQAGSVLMLCNACVPILTISLFALVRDDTNIFFMNSTHVGYRILEFNLGSCFYTCTQCYPLTAKNFMLVFQHALAPVIIAFALLWWAQLGAPVHATYATCIRMYYFSPCIQMHHGFLMRGCLLGVALISKVVSSDGKHAGKRYLEASAYIAPPSRHGALLTSAMTSILLIWPVCYAIYLLLEINFSPSLVRDNAALLSVVVPAITASVAALWNATWKVTLFDITDRCADRVCWCLPSRNADEPSPAV
jgi:hypothetical protein